MKQLMNYIEFVRLLDIDRVVKNEKGQITDLHLKAGKKRYCYLTDKELKLTNKSKEKDGNRSYDVEIKAFAEISPEDCNALNNRLVITGVADADRMYWIGDVDFPGTVVLLPDLNSSQINVTCQSLLPIF